MAKAVLTQVGLIPESLTGTLPWALIPLAHASELWPCSGLPVTAHTLACYLPPPQMRSELWVRMLLSGPGDPALQVDTAPCGGH